MQFEVTGPANDLLGLASAVDLVLMLPLAIYFFGFRKRKSVFILLALVFWGMLLANWVIPNKADAYLSYFTYSVIILEAAFITLELFLFITILKKMPTLKKVYKLEQSQHYHFLLSLSKAMQQTFTFKDNKIQLFLRFIATDIAAIYYSLFSWKRKAPTFQDNQISAFTFHKDGAYLGVFFMLVHAMLIEIIAIHLIVMQFSHMVAWIVTVFDIYLLLFIIADYQAIRLSPIILDAKGIHFQKGIRQYGFIPLHDIQGIRSNHKSIKEIEKDQKGLSLALQGLEKDPIPYVLILNKPVKIRHFFGKSKEIESIYLKLDDPQTFIDCLGRDFENK